MDRIKGWIFVDLSSRDSFGLDICTSKGLSKSNLELKLQFSAKNVKVS
jgi:hypothetical protein